MNNNLKFCQDMVKAGDKKRDEIVSEVVKQIQVDFVNPILVEHRYNLDTGMGSCSIETDEFRFYSEKDYKVLKHKILPTTASNDDWDAQYDRAMVIKVSQHWKELWQYLELKFERDTSTVGQQMEPYNGMLKKDTIKTLEERSRLGDDYCIDCGSVFYNCVCGHED